MAILLVLLHQGRAASARWPPGKRQKPGRHLLGAGWGSCCLQGSGFPLQVSLLGKPGVRAVWAPMGTQKCHVYFGPGPFPEWPVGIWEGACLGSC